MRELISSVGSLTKMIGLSQMSFSSILTLFGGLTQLIDMLVIITIKVQDSIQDFGIQVVKMSMHFSVDWKDENNWVVPSISIIPRVILFMKHTKAVGMLICLGWFSAPFWPLLFPDGYNPIREVMDIYEIPWCQGMILPGRGCNEEFVKQYWQK